MDQCSALLEKLREQTEELESIVKSQKIEQALELIEVRLLLLDDLHSLAKKNDQDRITIKAAVEEILPREQKLLLQLQEQKSDVTDLLGHVLSSNKAQLQYKKFSQE